jgi:small subunit ribosomal protein S7
MSATPSSIRNQLKKRKVIKQNISKMKKTGELSARKRDNSQIISQKKIKELAIRWNKDILYQSTWLQKLLGKLTKNGKKAQAEKVIKALLTEINQICRGNPHVIFHEVLENLRPALTIVVRRVGRRFYQVPVPLKTLRQYTIALNWIVETIKLRQRSKIEAVLLEEFLSAYFFQKSETLKKKEQLSQLVIKNRAFNHYRWI